MTRFILAALLVACSSEGTQTAKSTGHFGDTCQSEADCVGLLDDLAPETNADDTVECAAAAGPKLCRFSCDSASGANNLDAEEACLTLGGSCVNGVCLP
jgi:hypothetical protein